MTSPKRWVIIAGELSGDRYGAALVRAIRDRESVTVTAIGGPQLKTVADFFLSDCTDHAAVGLRSIRSTRALFKVFDDLEAHIVSSPVDRAIIIDFPRYNFEIARRLKAHKIPIVTVITPNFWIWNDRRSARRIARYSDQIVTIFPAEYDLYRSIGATVAYFGNPLVDLMPPKPERPIGPHLGDGTQVPIRIGLFPGSRTAELKLLLRATVDAAARLARQSPRFQFVMPIARDDFRPWIEQECIRVGLSSIQIVRPLDSEGMRQVDVAVCATGTMTLELVLNRVPAVVLGALAPVSYWIATRILRIKLPFCGLPNLVAGRQIVPELMQSAIQPEAIAAAVIAQLAPDAQRDQQRRYSDLISILQGNSSGSVINRIADWITNRSDAPRV